ncbi:peptidoglycan DD-metalloendopeptidase family protein [Roseovarius salis]|uniref:peptidoglycan DD-metalloendopeptidase family protein n=1 Tax=Roseovarius salis TaxID=3376063 RepID=UPI0037C6E271
MFLASAALILATGCGNGGMDFDLRGAFGNAPSTTEAARSATADRPAPDARGIISYPGYQVAVARRGDTVASVAARIGSDAGRLASFNGLEPQDQLRDGEILALPERVSEPEGGPITPGGVDIATLAGDAIDEAEADAGTDVETTALEPAPSQRQPQGVSGVEPVRHKVERGETAYSIARLYDISVRSLADWNGLDSDFTVREGQYLLIPVALPDEPRSALKPGVEEAEAGDDEETLTTTLPGEGTEVPEPPSASKPLPEDDTAPASEPVETTAAPDLSEPEPGTGARMSMPVRGDIIRDYQKGKNDGIDIAAAPGTPVTAAASGTVAAITEDTNGVPIIVVKHPDNLLTVYSNLANVSVSKGDSVGRGDKLAEIRGDGAAAVHFEVREGFDSVDPNPYLE